MTVNRYLKSILGDGDGCRVQSSSSVRAGFTLIELLIVIAILGVLAVVVLLALNPVQQLARTRDAGRISTVTQLGHALEAYATTNNGLYPVENATWITTVRDAGEIASIPSMTQYTAPAAVGRPTPASCQENTQPAVLGFCYDTTTPATGGGPIVVYATLESQAQSSRCPAGQIAFAAYSTEQGRGGITCGATVAGGLNPAGIVFLP